MACTECHAAKVKCSNELPCARCIRLDRECIPHVSQQGRKRKACTEDAILTSQVVVTNNGSRSKSSRRANHYGLQYLVRSWISFAFRRRSMSLLSRATGLAVRAGLSLDQVFCESPLQRSMDFLHPILLKPLQQQQKQETTGKTLEWSDLPLRLRTATASEHDLGNRWIWVREMHQGRSRYSVSPAFDRDICPVATLTETFQANQQGVVDVFFADVTKDRSKHTRDFATQISLHASKDSPVRSSRGSDRLRIQTKVLEDDADDASVRVVEVEQVSCIDIMNLDHAFYYVEYIPVQQQQQQPPNNSESNKNDNTSSVMDFGDLPLLDMEELEQSADLEFLLQLLES